MHPERVHQPFSDRLSEKQSVMAALAGPDIFLKRDIMSVKIAFGKSEDDGLDILTL